MTTGQAPVPVPIPVPVPVSVPVSVAVVGMAVLLPGAPGLDAYWRNLRDGVDAIRDVPADRWDPAYYRPGSAAGPAVAGQVYCRRGGFVDGLAEVDVTRYGIMPASVPGTEPDQLIALDVAAAALADAGGEDRLPARDRIGVALGRGGYLTPGLARLDQRVRTAAQLTRTLGELLPDLSTAQLDRIHAAFTERLGPDSPESAIGLVPNLAASRIANRLDLRGPAYTVDAACASSLVAVDQAVTELTTGRCDLMLAGGVHHCHDITLWSVFAQLRALSPTQRIRPFHRDADGILVGEGTGVVVLKRLADAERDGDRVYAVIRGTGVAGDGRTAGLLAPDPGGQARAVRQAWRAAGLDPAAPDSVGLLEAHGTATPAGDAAELATLAEVFGPGAGYGDDGAARPVLGSVKSMIGHTMPAAGVAGLVKAALALHHGTLLPTLHCDTPHPALAATRFRTLDRARPWETGPRQPVRRAAVNAFGFGGINAHVVLEEAPGGRAAPAEVWGAAAGLEGAVGAGSKPVGAAPAGSVVVGAAPAGSGPVGAVPVGSVPEEATGVRPGLGKAVPPGPRSASAPARVTEPERILLLAAGSVADLAVALAADDSAVLGAGLDPARPHTGAGPVRLGIVAPTAKRLALARRAVAKGGAWQGRSDVWFRPAPLLGRPGGRLAFVFPGLEGDFTPRTDDIAAHFGLTPSPGTDVRVGDVGRHGFGVVGVGRLLDQALRRMGVVPDAVAGHSVGEWTAMAAAGLYAPDQVDAFMAGFDPDAVTVPGLAFAALGTSAAHVRAALAESWAGSGIVLSHDNAPRQSMVCGPGRAVEGFVRTLRGQGVICQVLPFRSGFHTPMLEPYLAPIKEAADRFRLHPPTVPVWSGTTAAPFPRAEPAVRELFVRHLLEPVRFRELTEALYAAGHRVFVQAGSGRLTSLIGDTLGDRDHLTIAANVPERDGMPQLRRVATALWAAGAPVSPTVPPCTAGAPVSPTVPLRSTAAPVSPAVPARPAGPPVSSAVPPRAAAPVPVRRRPPVRLDLGAALVSLDGPVLDALRAELRAGSRTAHPASPDHQNPASAHPTPTHHQRPLAAHPAPADHPGSASAQPASTHGPGPSAAHPAPPSHPGPPIADVTPSPRPRPTAAGLPSSGRPGPSGTQLAPRDRPAPAVADVTPPTIPRPTAAHLTPPARRGPTGTPPTPPPPPNSPCGPAFGELEGLAARFPAAAELAALLRDTAETAAQLISAARRPAADAAPAVPTLAGPTRAAPTLTGTTGAAPSVSAPSVSAPSLSAPSLSAPSVSAPSPSAPSLSELPPSELPLSERTSTAPLLAVPTPAATTVHVSPRTMPHLLDHCFFPQRPGWPDVEDRWPVVPATTIVRHMMDAAETAAAGLRAVAVHEARFDRWLTATPSIDIQVTVTPAPSHPHRVTVAFGPTARAVVELAPHHPAPPPPSSLPEAPERRPEHTAAQIYRERWMFHGPGFQGLTELTAIGERHIRGVITVPPGPGALLDNVGQLLGYWIMATRTERTVVFPVRMRHIRFHGPHPAPGTEVGCVLRITSLTDTVLEADAELTVGGRVWAVIGGWQDRRFDNDPTTRPVERFPERHTLSAAMPGGWALVHERWPDLASRELIMRNSLGGAERTEYAERPPRGRRQWLLGRIAVKDAVRQWLWQHGEGPVFPAELRVRNDESGRPYVTGVHGRALPPLDVSLAHRAEAGVAIVRPHTPRPGPGIDIEEVTECDPATLATALGRTELRLLRARSEDGPDPRALWFTRFWAAKEAVAKAEGVGFAGRPRDFTVLETAPDGSRLLVSGRLERVYTVHCAAVASPPALPDRAYVTAWTTGPGADDGHPHEAAEEHCR
ncbi:beta-ketoacyl synthase N-terminal-like domain-containing protein [Streptomyces sp. NPDC007205]|uniref:type I polyketide synthase n=1 Tax=Streptomyces sp. NPDC007205 TaxID=3154316 RepID=UPI0033C4574F